MTEKEFLFGESAPRILVRNCGDDLSIEGWDEPRVLLQYDSDQAPLVEVDGKTFTISSMEDLQLRIPKLADVQIEEVVGDTDVRGLSGTLTLKTGKSDVDVRRCRSVELGCVHGDVHARDIAGDFMAKDARSDVDIRQLQGALVVTAEGDVKVSQPVSRAEIRSRSDVSFILQPSAGSESKVEAKGDIRCLLAQNASVSISASAKGDLQVHPSLCQAAGPSCGNKNPDTILVGDGKSRLMLAADGDIWVGGWMDMGSSSDWSAFGKDMEQWGLEFGAMAGEFAVWMERNMREKYADWEKKLRKKMTETDFSRDRRRPNWEPTPPRPPMPPGVSESERLSILDMLQKGKISVDEAERLLSALERKG